MLLPILCLLHGAETRLQTSGCVPKYITYTQRCSRGESSALRAPCRYTPLIPPPVSKHRRTKSPVAAPAGIDLPPCVLTQRGHRGAAHSSISSTWLIRSFWVATKETGCSPSLRGHKPAHPEQNASRHEQNTRYENQDSVCKKNKHFTFRVNPEKQRKSLWESKQILHVFQQTLLKCIFSELLIPDKVKTFWTWVYVVGQ